MNSHRFARAVLAGVLALPLSLTLAAAPAAEPASAEPASEQLAPTMLVLDASGSMREDDPSGGTRMAAAKEALTTVVDKAPAGAELGLMAYGTTPGKVADDKELGCKDIKTLREVGPIDKAAFKNTINGVDGNGFTPVGASLKAAAEALPSEGPRAIVLVSDGEDTCAPPPPCDVARDLKEAGVDLTMHTVGFRVESKAREELKCIAEAGDGTYVDAPDAETLREQLPSITERALRTYELSGTPVNGSESLGDEAPQLGPGQFVDTIDDQQTKYYRLDVPEGFTVHASSAVIAPHDADIAPLSRFTTRSEIVDEQGERCVDDLASTGQWGPFSTISLSWNPGEDSRRCDTEGPAYFKVERDGPDNSSEMTFDLELQVVMEPPLAGDDGPDAPSGADSFEKPGGAMRNVTGGSGFNAATELPTQSGRYADAIGYGEVTTYKVWLDWGQSMAVRAHVGEGDVPGRGWTRFEARVHSPIRGGDDTHGSGTSTRNEPLTLDPIELPQVQYANRDARQLDDPPAIAGWHYITIWLRPEDSDSDIPVELEVSVGGTASDGPTYREVAPYPAEPIYAAPGTSTGERGPTPGTPSPDEPSPVAQSDAADAGGDGDDGQGLFGSFGPWLLVGAGALLLSAALTVVLVLVARGRRSGTA